MWPIWKHKYIALKVMAPEASDIIHRPNYYFYKILTFKESLLLKILIIKFCVCKQ